MAAPPTVEDLIRAGMAHHNAGRLQAAAVQYRQALARAPTDGNGLHLLGLVLHQLGQSADAVPLLRRATAARPDLPVFWFNLANVLSSVGDEVGAVDALGRAVALAPTYADAYQNLANAYQRLNRLPEAADALAHVARLRPAAGDPHAQLGQTLWKLGRWGQAEAALRQALAIGPDHHAARRDLAGVLNALRRSDEAAAEFRHLLTAAPAALPPPYHSNYLLALQYADNDPVDVLAESKRWAAAHAPEPPPPPAVHVAGRRVRVGYVSPDLGDHPVGRLIAPLLAGHDRDRFDVHCYSDWAVPDAVTDRLRSSVESWHNTGTLSDAALAEQVRRDGIDVLIDLAGHTARHRLLAFALRPAAVQVTYLGYPATTGLAAIDYRLTDAVADPVGVTDPYHTERLVRLPGCFLCLAPPTGTPGVAPPPAATDGHVTFGSFNAAAKIGPATVRLWAAVLATVPRSRLALKSMALNNAATRDGLVADLAAAGVDPGRVEVLPSDMTAAAHLNRYGQVDVALDPFPYHGTATTLDALWMGVPTVTLAGRTHVSRVGATLMTHAGLPEWVATSSEQYVAIAAARAADIDGLVELRATMRDRLRESPLMNAAGYVRGVEAAYDEMLATVD